MNCAILATVFAVWLFGAVRIELVYRVRMRRIDEISAANRRDAGRSDFVVAMNTRYDELLHPTYGEMIFDLSAWTYRQFYPRDVA